MDNQPRGPPIKKENRNKLEVVLFIVQIIEVTATGGLTILLFYVMYIKIQIPVTLSWIAWLNECHTIYLLVWLSLNRNTYKIFGYIINNSTKML